MKSWQVAYPDGVIKYIDLFREKYFQYNIFDQVVKDYIDKHSKSNGKHVVSLGSGTGRHEVELAKLGYQVIGLERNEESLAIAREYSEKIGVTVDFQKCDFLNEMELNYVMKTIGEVDIILLLFIPISIGDYGKALCNMKRWIKNGGIFVADNFGYTTAVDQSHIITKSNVEVATDPISDKDVVRLNYYEYFNNVVNWDAIYLYYDDENTLVMKKDHDILEVVPEKDVKNLLIMDEEGLEFLPTYRVTECEEYIAPPYLYEYLIGWRKM